MIIRMIWEYSWRKSNFIVILGEITKNLVIYSFEGGNITGFSLDLNGLEENVIEIQSFINLKISEITI